MVFSKKCDREPLRWLYGDFRKDKRQKGEKYMIRGFPEVMKSQRKKLNISINKLSKLSNINKSTLYKYERGDVSPNGVRLLTLCSILKIDYKVLEI